MGTCHSSSRPSLLPFLSTPFANYLTPAQLTTFSIYFVERSYSPSSIIFNYGDIAGDYYIFLSGIAHIFADDRYLCSKGKGDTINTTIITSQHLNQHLLHTSLGKLATSPLPRHTCSLHAVTATKLLYLSHKKLVEYIANNPDTSQLLLPLLTCPFISLTTLSFFSTMSSQHLNTLSCYMLRMQALKTNETLFVEGSLGQSVYILQTGQLKAVASTATTTTNVANDKINNTAAITSSLSSNPNNTSSNNNNSSIDQEKVLHIFKDSNPDDRIFGEIALIMDIPRTASIISITNSIVLEWKREDYKTFLSLSSSQTQPIQNMMKSRTAEHFRKYKVPFFDSIPEEKYAILASLCKIEERGPGEIIFSEGERGTQFYLLAYGEVKVTMKRKKKDKKDTTTPDNNNHNNNNNNNNNNGATNDTGNDNPNKLNKSKDKHQSSLQDLSDSDIYSSIKMDHYGSMKGTLKGMGTLMWGRRNKANHNNNNNNNKTKQLSSTSDNIDGQNDTVEICRMGPGKYFGEIALVQDTPRTATVTTVTRCIILSITKENFQIFFNEAPEAIADFEIKLARYDVQLRSVLYHPLGLSYFMNHCKREYTSESVEFWLQCRDYRHLSIDSYKKQQEEYRIKKRRMRIEQEKKQKKLLLATEQHQTTFNFGYIDTSQNIRGDSLSQHKDSSKGGYGIESTKKASNNILPDTPKHMKGDTESNNQTHSPSNHNTNTTTTTNNNNNNSNNNNNNVFDSFTDSDYTDDLEDASDLHFLFLCATEHNSFHHRHLMNRNVLSLFNIFNLHYSTQKNNLFLTIPQFKSIMIMLDIFMSDTVCEELCTILKESNDRIWYKHFISSFFIPPSSTPSQHRILRKIYRRIYEYDLDDIRQEFDAVSQYKKGFLNIAEFQTILHQLHINIPTSTDATTLYYRLSAPLSLYSTTLPATSNRYQTSPSPLNNQATLNFPIFLSFVLHHVHDNHCLYTYLLSHAQHIYDTYISDSARHQVNIKGHTQKKIQHTLSQHKINQSIIRWPTGAANIDQQPPAALQQQQQQHQVDPQQVRWQRWANRHHHLNTLDIHLFDMAEEEVVALLSADTFARFKQSELFQQFLVSAQAYTEVKTAQNNNNNAHNNNSHHQSHHSHSHIGSINNNSQRSAPLDSPTRYVPNNSANNNGSRSPRSAPNVSAAYPTNSLPSPIAGTLSDVSSSPSPAIGYDASYETAQMARIQHDDIRQTYKTSKGKTLRSGSIGRTAEFKLRIPPPPTAQQNDYWRTLSTPPPPPEEPLPPPIIPTTTTTPRAKPENNKIQVHHNHMNSKRLKLLNINTDDDHQINQASISTQHNNKQHHKYLSQDSHPNTDTISAAVPTTPTVRDVVRRFARSGSDSDVDVSRDPYGREVDVVINDKHITLIMDRDYEGI